MENVGTYGKAKKKKKGLECNELNSIKDHLVNHSLGLSVKREHWIYWLMM